MLISYTRPSAIAVTIAGTGATIVTSTDELFDGRPGSVTRFTWLTGTQTTASVLDLELAWPVAANIRVVGLLGCTLPAGTRIVTQLSDGAGGWIAPTGGNDDDRLEVLPGGNVGLWQVFDPPAAPVAAIRIRIFNDVNGSADIVPGSDWDLGELWLGPAVELPLAKGWSVELRDTSIKRRSLSGQPWPVQRPSYRILTGELIPTHGDEVRRDALANNEDWESLRRAMTGAAPAVCIPRRWTDFSGVLDPAELQRQAIFGFRQVGSISHAAGDYFRGDWTFEEVP